MAAISHHSLTNYQPNGSPSDGGTHALGRLLQQWRARSRERRVFINFDDRELQDLGMARWDVERELAKPFWHS